MSIPIQVLLCALLLVSNFLVNAPKSVNGNVVSSSGSKRNNVRRQATQKMKASTYIVYAHTVHFPSVGDWALDQGANGIEMDLTFQGEQPLRFHHGYPCDCTCYFFYFWVRDNICKRPESICGGGSVVGTMFSWIIKKGSKITSVYVDSKTNTIDGVKYQAGVNTGKKVLDELFIAGYKGIVVMSAPKIGDRDYLRGVSSVINNSKFKSKLFYTIDEEESNEGAVYSELSSLSSFTTYSVGISACLYGNYQSQITNAVQKYSLPPAIWTIDLKSSFNTYIDKGARQFITNEPKDGVSVARSRGLEPAQQEDF